jgi:hypothetical protein
MTEQGTMSEQAVFDALKYRVEVNKRGTRRYYNAAKQLHRTDGPAIEYSDGVKVWFLYGRDYDEDDFPQALAELGLGPTNKRTA